jgi:GMP synthase-like glutamine amidotransferase
VCNGINVKQAIRIAILDSVPEVYWVDDLGITDAQKFIDLLQPVNPAARFDIFFTSKDQFPPRLNDYDAILVTGSPCSVHDDHDWIARLIEVVQEAEQRNLRIIGSCFGHQLVACAFGGDVGYNEQGWVIGNYSLHISGQFGWMQPQAPTTALYHFNQERVTRLPKDAIAFARTDEYDDYGYTIGDNILCFQGHPEQPLRAMKNFLNTTDNLSADERAKAERCIAAGEPDALLWGQWMMQFFVN